MIGIDRRCPHRLKIGTLVSPARKEVFLPGVQATPLTGKFKSHGVWWGTAAGLVFPLWKVRRHVAK